MSVFGDRTLDDALILCGTGYCSSAMARPREQGKKLDKVLQ